MRSYFILISYFSCGIYFCFAKFIDVGSIEEGPCIVPPVDLNLDLVWVATISTYYYPIISKYALYQYTISLLGGDAKNITEEMAHHSCHILHTSGESGAELSAFKGAKKTTIDGLVTDHGIFDWVEKKSDGSPGYRGRTYVTLSDNENFMVTVSCYENENQKSYAVIGADTKTIDEETKKTVRKHLQELGFNLTKTYVELDYDKCFDLSDPYKNQTRTNTIFNPSVYNVDNVTNVTNEANSGNADKFDKIDQESILNKYFEKFKEIQTSEAPSSTVSTEKIHVPPTTAKVEIVPIRKEVVPIRKEIVPQYQPPRNAYYNNDNDRNIDSPSPSRSQDSIALFFNIFRTAIDFMQNFFRNSVNYMLMMMTRVIGRINTAGRP